ncbi:hypothetical protein CC80DRAFT_593280 [Byssothecium circinans]|uniref:Uncharacterized protein n=1 Tax=Byssothecium circinans TaxID=147558 RepID=A0A6A5U0L2_9PLEO|nr:hypothetical protein CC80DRAFT_593280 [Byssothecium circinans]
MLVTTFLQRALAVAPSLSLALLITAVSAQQPNGMTPPPTPYDNLPPTITPLTYFGERPSFSPDGNTIVFMCDAYTHSLTTHKTTLLTRTPHPGYLRVQYLPNGDFFLIGPKALDPFSPDLPHAREAEQEMWIIPVKTYPAGPQDLGRRRHLAALGRSAATNTTTIAWANSHGNYLDLIAENDTIIYTAEIAYLPPDSSSTNANTTTAPRPTLQNKKKVLHTTTTTTTVTSSSSSPQDQSLNLSNITTCNGRAEPQDFFFSQADTPYLTYSCYTLHPSYAYTLSDVYSLNLLTGASTLLRRVDGEYNEVEGIFPDEKSTLVKSTREQLGESRIIDLWKMSLDVESGNMGGREGGEGVVYERRG